MKINNKDSKRGRPRADDPKIKLTNVRLKTSTIIDIEVIAEQLDKEISLFPLRNNKRISFKDIETRELLKCIKRFKKWANLNGFEWKSDQEEWERLCKLYE